MTDTPNPSPTGQGAVSLDRLVTPCHVWVDGAHAAVLIGWGTSHGGTWYGRVLWAPPGDASAAVDWIAGPRLTPA